MTPRRRFGWDAFLTFPAAGGLVLGIVGLAQGVHGQPGITAAPLGVVLGIALGAAAALLNWRTGTFLIALMVGGFALSGAAAYWRLPESRRQGSVIDAEVRGCDLSTKHVPAAVARWERLNAETLWRSPRPGWKEDVPRMLTNSRGVVLTLFVHRKRDVYEQRKPWNRGQLMATRWQSVRELQRYFATASDESCERYAAGVRRFFWPEWERSTVSPPDVLPNFLGLNVLRDVPPQFREFAEP